MLLMKKVGLERYPIEGES